MEKIVNKILENPAIYKRIIHHDEVRLAPQIPALMV
jgi:hypothetical protein